MPSYRSAFAAARPRIYEHRKCPGREYFPDFESAAVTADERGAVVEPRCTERCGGYHLTFPPATRVMSAPPAVATVTRYRVSCLPEDVPEGGHWALHVEYRGGGLWAVTDGAQIVDARGSWHHEPRPSGRTDRWRRKHYHHEADALALAREIAPTVEVNGLLPADVLAQHVAGGR